jgi:uncharacterized protein (DUF1778 family)
MRAPSRVHDKLKRAAAYLNKSVTDFVLEKAENEADRVIKEHEKITLHPHDFQNFLDALDNPPKPSPDLKKAAQEHMKKYGYTHS